jgi:parallel beta-helix repeat protein
MTGLRRLSIAVFVVLLLLPMAFQSNLQSESIASLQETNLASSYTPHDEIWIYGNEMFVEQAELEGWPGNGTSEDPFLISGYYFNTWDKPLTIYHTTLYWIFTNNLIDGEDDHGGTWIQNCTNGAIIDNEICNRRFGIAVAGGYGINITGNHVHDCWENGIEFIAGMNGALVQNNTIENIGVAGFYSGLSHESTIANNTLRNCGNYGISLLGVTSNCTVADNCFVDCGNATMEGVGMRVTTFESSEISSNTLTTCTSHGIMIDTGRNSSIVHNTITNTSGYAVVLLLATSQISMKFNIFIDNGPDCQILDNGTLNEISHNYYNDWTTPDDNSDGYVDVPYLIDGASENSDPFPLTTAGVIPIETAGFSIPGTIVGPAVIIGLIAVVVMFFVKRPVHSSI